MFSRLKSRLVPSSTTTTAPEPQSEEEKGAALRKAVSEDIKESTESFVTDGCLQRYLRARDMDVDKAARMLRASLQWRASYEPHTIADRMLPTLRTESATGKMYVLPDADEQKRATVVMRPGLENSKDSTGKIANLVYTLERASKLAENAGGERFVVVVDYGRGEISTSTLPSLSVSRETTNILQGHYPERLSCMVLIQAPRIFLSMFKLIKPLIDQKTREKLHFVNDPHDVAAVPGVDAQALPLEYGGEMDWTFDVNEYFEGEEDAHKKTAH